MDNQAGWRKPRRSNGQGACVEVGNGTGGVVLVRDTKEDNKHDRPTLSIPADAWQRFARGL